MIKQSNFGLISFAKFIRNSEHSVQLFVMQFNHPHFESKILCHGIPIFLNITWQILGHTSSALTVSAHFCKTLKYF